MLEAFLSEYGEFLSYLYYTTILIACPYIFVSACLVAISGGEGIISVN